MSQFNGKGHLSNSYSYSNPCPRPMNCFFHDSFYHHTQGLLMKGNYGHLETS